jgi:NitT/TauT family transport system permease protein
VPRAADVLHPRNWLPPVLALCLVLVAWELVAVNDHLLLPTLGAVGSELVNNKEALLAEGGDTLAEALPGVAISYCVALLLAVAMSEWQVVNRAVLPLAVALSVSPLITIAPALGAALGLGHAPKIVLTAIITFFPTLINSLVGLRSADPQAVEVFETLSASRWETLWHLRLPSSLPYLFAAARVVVPLSVVGAAIAEMASNGAINGLGILIDRAAANTQLALAWAGIATLAVFGLALTAMVVVSEDRVLRWRGFR